MMKYTLSLFCFFLLLLPSALSQEGYNLFTDVPVSEYDQPLPDPFAGGINSVVVNMLDFDEDGKEDLILYERTTQKLKIFRADGQNWVYSPEIVARFPQISNWMLLRDFNNDGKKDLFTSHPLGIMVYVNTSQAGVLSWRPFNNGNALEATGNGISVNIYIGENDLPSIEDINGDGLLDIVNFGFLSNTLEYNQNSTATPDTLVFEKITDKWGNIEECGCGLYSNSVPCADLTGGRIEHINGRTLLATDIDGDGDKDLLMGEEGCFDLNLLENTGSANNAFFDNFRGFPASYPAGIFAFPAPYMEDLDHDGVKDFILTSHTTSNYFYYMNFKNNFHYYKNEGSELSPQYQLKTMNYLHNAMIDVGENCHPVFEDIDNDGDLDMIVGRQTDIDFSGRSSSLYLYENTGTVHQPSFKLLSQDFLGLSSYTFFNIKPQLADVNGDRNIDLIFTANVGDQGTARIYYVLNPSFFHLNTDPHTIQEVDFKMSIGEQAYFHDFDNDNDLEMLLGKSDGRLHFYENTGNRNLKTFELINNDYLNLSFDGTFYGSPYVEIGDIDNTHSPDILVFYNSNKVRVFYDFLEQGSMEGSLSLSPDNPSLSPERALGSINRIVLANLFHEDKPALVVGTREGGMHLLRNNNARQILIADEFYSISPNPSLSEPFINFDSNKNIIVQVYSISGQKISGDLKIRSKDDFNYYTGDLATGVYLARIYYDDYYYEVKKFIMAN